MKKRHFLYTIGVGLGLYSIWNMKRNQKENYWHKFREFWPALRAENWYSILTDSDKRDELKIRWRYAETKVSYGKENPEKTFYVIRHCIRQGIFSMLNYDIAHLFYAEEHGYIPVIDERSFCNFMNDDSLTGKENVWDMFLEQPAVYTLEDIAKSKNVILSNALGRPITKEKPLDWRNYHFGRDSKGWNQVFHKYYRFLPEVTKHIEVERNKVFGEKENILGVAIRRGIARSIALGRAESNNHAIEFSLNEIIEIIKKSMEKYKLEYVFCTSDDQESLETMKMIFGEKLLFLQRERNKLYENGKEIKDVKPVEDRYAYTLAYITEIMLLAQCNMLIAGRNGGSVAADIFNNGYYDDVIQITKKKFYKSEKSKFVVKNDIVSICEK